MERKQRGGLRGSVAVGAFGAAMETGVTKGFPMCICRQAKPEGRFLVRIREACYEFALTSPSCRPARVVFTSPMRSSMFTLFGLGRIVGTHFLIIDFVSPQDLVDTSLDLANHDGLSAVAGLASVSIGSSSMNDLSTLPCLDRTSRHVFVPIGQSTIYETSICYSCFRFLPFSPPAQPALHEFGPFDPVRPVDG